MSQASDAYQRLTAALVTLTPDCTDDPLFTADDLTAADKATCAAICTTCPLFELCETYAQLDRPKAGVWAGRTYNTKKAST